ncbi:hypothetical protein VTJ04DRAFT_8434 [Mycothermus thermophilus]|uniref:uncharacterized protein n=1 Tax=Humicola insolens TaxID=85995 RepID=UPI0037433068
MGHSSGCQGILERAFAFAPIFGVAGGDGFGINSVERQRSIELVLREVPQNICALLRRLSFVHPVLNVGKLSLLLT